jgi:hypothetical protein
MDCTIMLANLNVISNTNPFAGKNPITITCDITVIDENENVLQVIGQGGFLLPQF